MSPKNGTGLAVICLLLAACRASPPAVGDVLQAPAWAEAPAAPLDEAARAARGEADLHPGDPEFALAAARALFGAADVRLQDAILAYLDSHPDLATEAVIAAQDQIPLPDRDPIRALCREGYARAKHALELSPDSAAALQYRAQHLSLLAWSEGPSGALLAGHAGRIAPAIDAAVQADPAFEGAAPLRTEGRFRSMAPWPYRDLDRARAALEQAVALAPLPVNELFLGDALFLDGAKREARAAWKRALSDAPDETSAAVTPLYRRQAQRRLEGDSTEPHTMPSVLGQSGTAQDPPPKRQAHSDGFRGGIRCGTGLP